MEQPDSSLIQDGDYIVIQRQNYMKIHKIPSKNPVSLGKDEIEINSIIGDPYWSTYKMEPKANSKRVFLLKRSEGVVSLTDEIIKDVTSGIDNREILDDGRSQKLSTEEIVNLRECGLSAQDIVTQLVENSKTFMNKTEYSQEKYLKKKEKKYYEYITIRRPNFRLIADILLRQPLRVLGIRMDTLAQLSTIACVRSGGTYILYESGCMGLVAASLLDRIGPEGTVINVHPAYSDQPTHAVLSLNLKKDQLSRLVNVNVHNLVQRTFQESTNEVPSSSSEEIKETSSEENVMKRKLDSDSGEGPPKKRKRQEEEERAINFLSQRKADALLIVGREHPSNIFKHLVKFLEISRPFVIYSPVREPLQDLYVEIKSRSDIIGVRLTESWLRSYQVLPERTHPDINISGSGGFLLSGILVSVGMS